MTPEIAELVREIRDFVAAAPHDYPGYSVALLERAADALARSSERTVECSCSRAGFPNSCDNCDADSGPIRFWRERALQNEWQPIETAPRDGVSFLAWVPSNRCVYAVAYHPYRGLTIFGGDFRDHLQRATHWMPMPASPAVVSSSVTHASDCAVHNGPALPAGPCDCGALSGSTEGGK